LADYLIDDDYRELQAKLGASPEPGDLMPARAGFESCAGQTRGVAKARRGGLRIIYYHFKSDRQIWLMTLYDKNEASELTAKEKKALRASIENELAARAARRVTGLHRLGRTR